MAVDLDFLMSCRVSIGEERRPSFSLYQCLTATVEHLGKTFVHDERLWYWVPQNVLEAINYEICRIPPMNGLLPHSAERRMKEPDYNEMAGVEDIVNLDRQSQAVFAGEDPIEICDLLTFAEGRLTFIHVKRDFSSSSLSHLFNQGRVSARALLESEPRERFRGRIESVIARRAAHRPNWSRRLRGLLGAGRFAPSNFRIVYGILGNWGAESPAARLPFFSKLMLVRAARELRGREFDVRIARLQMPAR